MKFGGNTFGDEINGFLPLCTALPAKLGKSSEMTTFFQFRYQFIPRYRLNSLYLIALRIKTIHRIVFILRSYQCLKPVRLELKQKAHTLSNNRTDNAVSA